MTRIIAGTAGGRRLAVPPAGTRPTSDRVREALFSALEHDPGLDGAAVLDLCAGSGALGLEALSRGAEHALLVESDRRAAGVLRRKVTELGLPGAEVRACPAGTVLAAPAPRPYDLVLVDPPYDLPEADLAGVLTAIGPALAPHGVVVVERASRTPEPTWPTGLVRFDRRAYGDTVMWFAEPDLGAAR